MRAQQRPSHASRRVPHPAINTPRAGASAMCRRTWLSPALRLLLHTVPSFRRIGVGGAMVLEHLPRSGWSGAAADVGRVIVGERLAAGQLTLSPSFHTQTECACCGPYTAGSACPLLTATGLPLLLAAGARLFNSMTFGLVVNHRPSVTLATQLTHVPLTYNSPGCECSPVLASWLWRDPLGAGAGMQALWLAA